MPQRGGEGAGEAQKVTCLLGLCGNPACVPAPSPGHCPHTRQGLSVLFSFLTHTPVSGPLRAFPCHG